MSAYLDIETTSAAKWLAAKALEEGLQANDPRMVEWLAAHAADGALNPHTGRVVCWAVCTDLDATEWSEVGHERDILPALATLLDELADDGPIVAHNGSGFDFPYLRARALARGLPGLAKRLWQDKPWDRRVVDTSDPSWFPRPAHAGKGWTYTLDSIADLLGVERAKTLPGKDVPAAFYQSRFADIREHCLDDVRTLREVARRLDAGRAA